MEIKLSDFNSPLFSELRYFLYDPARLNLVERMAKSNEKLTLHSAGWGSNVSIKRVQSRFVAIYLDERAIKAALGDAHVTLNDRMRATITTSWPINKVFKLCEGSADIVSVQYIHAVDDCEDSDLLEHIAEVLNDPTGLKKFAYQWSALRAGRARALTKYGLTNNLVGKISDPFEPDRDVTD